MNFLDKIINSRKTSISDAKKLLPPDKLKNLVSGKKLSGNFRRALMRLPNGNIKVIAEIKRASPSKGTIAADIDPATVARDYEAGNASAISVLTEPTYFKGTSDDFRAVRDSVPGMPLLRKDFIIDEYQIYESVLLGADAVLLIVAVLNQTELKRLKSVADECGMDSLIEVHSEKELDVAIAVGAQIVGVNNRDLTTFNVSQEVSERISRIIPDGIVSVSESGITDISGLDAAAELGYDAVLIGEHFMRAKNRAAEVRQFTTHPISQNSRRAAGI